MSTPLLAALIPLSAALIACSPSLGEPEALGGCQLYTRGEVKLEASEAVRAFLSSEGFCEAEGRRVLIEASSKALVLKIATLEGPRRDPEYLKLSQAFAGQLSAKALGGAPVDIGLCDAAFEACVDAPGFRWGRYISRDKCGLYVSDELGVELAERALTLLDEDLGCQSPRDFRLERKEGVIQLYVVLSEGLTQKAVAHQARLSAGRASRVLFDKAPVQVHLTDAFYTPIYSAMAVDLGPMVTRGACRVFQGEGLSPEHLTRFMGFIDLAGYCARDEKVYRLSKSEEGWRLAIVIGDELPFEMRKPFKVAIALVAAMLRGGVFEGEATTIDLCDPVFERCESIVGPDFGTSFLLGTCSIFHDPEIDAQRLSRFRAWLSSEGFCEGAEQLLRLRREGDTWALHLAVRAELVGSEGLKTLGERITGALSARVFGGEPVRFVGTNEALIEHKVTQAPLSPAP